MPANAASRASARGTPTAGLAPDPLTFKSCRLRSLSVVWWHAAPVTKYLTWAGALGLVWIAQRGGRKAVCPARANHGADGV
jgi:hypothetical protein